MPNIINENGITIKTQDELVSEISNGLRDIYGPDINLDPDSPDMQLLMIYVLASLDVLQLLVEAYNSFDPDKAVGKVLDQRVQLNGVQRKAGTYTIQTVSVVVSEPVTLYGLDQTIEEVYTVADDAGTEFQLGETVTLESAGGYSLVFQAAEIGKTEVLLNTITNPVTVVLPVVSVNNPTGPISIGQDEETDVQLRIRRQKSTSISGLGWKDSLEAALYNINGITDAKVYENPTGENPDANGIPSHSIWVIVSGTYSDAEVADAIYTKRNAGAGMLGQRTYGIVQKDSTVFVVKWDDVETEDIFIKLTIEAIDPAQAIDIDLIRTRLAEGFNVDIGGVANINNISSRVQAIEPNALVTSAGLSLLATGPFTAKLSNSAKNKKFVLSYDNVIITPIAIYPKDISVVGGATPESRTILAYGGFGTYTWSILVDNSGAGGTPASIDASGFYTPGTGTQDVLDTIQVADSQGNLASIQVQVT